MLSTNPAVMILHVLFSCLLIAMSLQRFDIVNGAVEAEGAKESVAGQEEDKEAGNYIPSFYKLIFYVI